MMIWPARKILKEKEKTPKQIRLKAHSFHNTVITECSHGWGENQLTWSPRQWQSTVPSTKRQTADLWPALLTFPADLSIPIRVSLHQESSGLGCSQRPRSFGEVLQEQPDEESIHCVSHANNDARTHLHTHTHAAKSIYLPWHKSSCRNRTKDT